MRRDARHERLRAIPQPVVDLAPRSTRLPRYIAIATAVAGLITLVSAASFPLSGRVAILSDVVPLAIRTGATSLAVLAGFGLLVVAGALARRQRQAWWVALLLLIVVGVSHLLRELDVLDAGLSLGLAAVLVMARRDFDARPGPGSLPRALLAVPTLAGVVWAFGWVAIFTYAAWFRPTPTLWSAAVSSAKGLVGLDPGFVATGGVGRWIPGLLPVLGVIVLVVSLALAFRPVVEGIHRSPGDATVAGALVRRFGADTLSYFALREDKSYFVHGQAVIAYRYLWNLALVSGDPCGDPADVPGALAAFVLHARAQGWGVAVLAGSEDHAQMYADVGLRALYIGDEALIDPRSFSLEGRPIRKVRQSCHRLERLGYTLEFIADTALRPDLRDALEAVTASWRGRAPERGFTMALGRAPSPQDPDCLTVVGRDAEGRTQGFLHLVPCFGEHPGFSLDQMRRRPGTPNGLTEWMVARAAEELGRRGVSRFSLNFAFLGGLFRAKHRLGPIERAELAVVRRLSPFFQIESLHDFNAKFFPSWVPRYIYYEAPTSLPRVALAYLEAEAFVRTPLIGTRARLRRRRTGDTAEPWSTPATDRSRNAS